MGGVVSPLLANIYLHYVFDLWADRWQKKHARGDVVIVRYADDFVVGFQYRQDALRFLGELKERLRKFSLELHAKKTRLLEFGRFAAWHRKQNGEGKPETFNFLGFTHICSVDRRGKYIVRRHTMRQRLTSELKQLTVEMKERRHGKLKEQIRWLSAVLRGHFQYYGVPRNIRLMQAFYTQVLWHWRRALMRRSHQHKLPWKKFCRKARRWLPHPRITHPYPDQRLRVTT